MSQLNQWCTEAGGGIKIEFESKEPKDMPTATDETNPFLMELKRTLVDDL